ncbi:MAG: hypothetical protein WA131_00445 [Desulfitobacteriaceae bacterium]
MEKKQDQEIWLRPNELERMIQGSLHWTEVAARLERKLEKVSEGESLGVVQKPVVHQSSPKPLKKLEGLAVVLLLAGVALSTMVTWIYFVFYR